MGAFTVPESSRFKELNRENALGILQIAINSIPGNNLDKNWLHLASGLHDPLVGFQTKKAVMSVAFQAVYEVQGIRIPKFSSSMTKSQ